MLYINRLSMSDSRGQNSSLMVVYTRMLQTKLQWKCVHLHCSDMLKTMNHIILQCALDLTD
jgi:hypothetical protein